MIMEEIEAVPRMGGGDPGSTFFKSGYMDYLDENVPEEKPEPVKKPSGRNTVSLLELVRAKEERERHGQGSGS